jgi:hypothetical protein
MVLPYPNFVAISKLIAFIVPSRIVASRSYIAVQIRTMAANAGQSWLVGPRYDSDFVQRRVLALGLGIESLEDMQLGTPTSTELANPAIWAITFRAQGSFNKITANKTSTHEHND